MADRIALFPFTNPIFLDIFLIAGRHIDTLLGDNHETGVSLEPFLRSHEIVVQFRKNLHPLGRILSSRFNQIFDRTDLECGKKVLRVFEGPEERMFILDILRKQGIAHLSLGHEHHQVLPLLPAFGIPEGMTENRDALKVSPV